MWLAVLAVFLWSCSFDCWHRIEPARTVAARAQIDNFLLALKAYKKDVGDFPSTAEGLQALRVSPGRSGWNGPYLAKDIPLDPWGVPYNYRYPGLHGTGPDIVSYGADRLLGGEGMNADVVSWRK
jgi:general secretion pathway protein G